jgi:8-oxo-dGTP diphosphatase
MPTGEATPPDRTRAFLVRHADAGDRARWKGDDRERPLTKRGRRQAEGLVDLLRDEPVSRILSSPYVRCRQTVEPLAAARGLPVEDAPELEEGAGTGPLRRLLGVVEDAVLCSHGDVIQEFLDLLRRRGVAVDGGLAKGSVWILDLVHGEVFAARYLPPAA